MYEYCYVFTNISSQPQFFVITFTKFSDLARWVQLFCVLLYRTSFCIADIGKINKALYVLSVLEQLEIASRRIAAKDSAFIRECASNDSLIGFSFVCETFAPEFSRVLEKLEIASRERYDFYQRV